MSWFNPFEGGGTGGGGSSTAYATSLVLSLNTETYELTATLKNKDGDTLGTPQVIDLPLETMVVSGRYDENTKMVILVLSNGQEISFSVADLISGLQSEITVNNKLDIELIDCEGSHYKIVWVGTSAEYTAAASSIPENIPVIKTDDDDMDQTPTENSENLVSSGGVYSFVVQGLAGKANSSDLGTAASRDVPTSGNASTTQVVMGNDTRLTDARPASDVSEWAKALTKPSYSYSEISNTPTVDTAPTSGSNNLISSGGVYTALDNKVDKVSGKQLSTEDYTTAEKTKLGGIEAEANKTVVDSALSGSSTNPVQNKVVANALNGKQDTLTIDTTPTQGSSNPVTSNGIFDALAGKVGKFDYATVTTAGIVKPDGVTTEVDENGVISVSTFSPTSWDGVQNIVRAGLASKFFKVRDQLQCMKGNTVLTWDIIGIDQETPTDPLFTHSLTLQLHDCFGRLQFDGKEALFAFPNGLAAGAYKFTVGEQPWYAADIGKIITFTLSQAIPAGGQLVLNNSADATMIGATISSYASGGSATAIETAAMSEGSAETEATNLGTVNNAGTPADHINSIRRAFCGSNNWKTSAIRQYLNSNAAAGSVWTPQTEYDRPPTWAANTSGFLNGLDSDFVTVLGGVEKTTAVGATKEETIDTVFLLSQAEAYCTGIDGTAYTYYSEYSDLSSPGYNSDSNRVKTLSGSAVFWALRTSLTYIEDITLVTTVGAVSQYWYVQQDATTDNAFAPVCVIV